jgi:pimeloyl-ACP methyl ester carboxylesterase
MYKSPEGYRAFLALYDRTLQKLKAPYQIKAVPTRYGETQVLVTGPQDAPPLVLVHGWSVNGPNCWIPQINALAGTYRLYVPDVPGQPGKSVPVSLSARGYQYPAWFCDMLDGLKVQQASFAGISFGGWLIFKLATLAPERIKRAALLAPAGLVNFSPVTFNRIVPYSLFPNRENTIRFLKVISGPGWQPPEEVIEHFYIVLKYFKPTRNIMNLPAKLSDGDLRKLTAPTLLINGTHDSIFKAQPSVERAQKVLPNLVGVQPVAGAGHLLPYEQPEKINQLLLNFFK